ncbi:hypothetical protein ACX2QB_05930 [Weissella viridescens]
MKIITRIINKLMPKKTVFNLEDSNNISISKKQNEPEDILSKNEEAFDLLEEYRHSKGSFLSILSNPSRQKKSLSKIIDTFDDNNTLNTGEILMLWWCNGKLVKSNQTFPKYFNRIYNINPFKTLNKLKANQLIDASEGKYSLSNSGKSILDAHIATINNHKNQIYFSESDYNKLKLSMTAANINLIDKGTLLLMSNVDKSDPNIHMLSQTIEQLKNSQSHNFICPLQKVDSQLVKYLDDSWQNKIAILNEVNDAESKLERTTLYKKIREYPDLSILDIKFKFNISYSTDENHQIFLLSKELTKEKKYQQSNKFTLWAMHEGYQRTETWLRLAINYRYLKDLKSEENALEKGILWCRQCNEDGKKLTDRLHRVHELMSKELV